MRDAKVLKYVSAAGLAALLVLLPLLHRPVAATPARQASAQPAGEALTTTLADQSELALTVYNSNLSLVRDVRQLNLPAGESVLRFMDIAASINPATVHFRSLTDPAKLSVAEQNYEYDLLDPNKLLQKFVGREVTLVRPKMAGGTTEYDEVKATLLSLNGAPVWKIGNEIVTGLSYESIRFPELPENLYERPTLLWTLQNTGARRQRVEASYLTANLSWSADYVLNVAKDEASGDLDGWVTLVNHSGTQFKNASLQLVAGDLHRVMAQNGMDEMRAMGAVAKSMPAAPQFQQESFSEYHLYSLNRRTSIFDQESKQISLLNASRFPIRKVYVVNGQTYYYRQAAQPGAPIKDPVQVFYKFKNEEKAGLGMPLPAGTIRVYQQDSRGGSLFAGEDHIDHTPKDEEISLHIGNAFDIVAERKQTDYKKLSDRLYEFEYEVTLRNHKEIPISVEVNEPIGGDWEMINSTYKFTKTAAFAAQFDVPVDKDGTSVLKYRVRVRY
ncbi:MAG TPA: DUF4139 domain-containing protein [Candidatus Sulfotelmatobacter sp.]|jgi:hypothetical protein|nr:DUF4139 domain-containing protein [Candidatus Sulfotelmatobacter sp.]